MSNPVATINGVPVFSNKGVQSIVNTRVSFTDGSWCDVRTGEVVNNGSGFITLNTPPQGQAGEGTHTVGPKSFDTANLRVLGLDAKLDIQPTDGKMSVTITGPKSFAEAVRVQPDGDTLVISGENGRRGGGSVVAGNVVISGGSISIGGGSSRVSVSNVRAGGNTIISGGRGGTVVMTGGSGDSNVLVSVKVPKGTPITLEDSTSETTIGDTEGSLNASLKGSAELTAGRMTTIVLNTGGQSEARVAEVSETLMVSASGQSEVRVNAGSVQMCNISTGGQSEVCFRGTAQTMANLTSSGQSEIRVFRVTGQLLKSEGGQSSIRVG